jgi:hypothetical protein
MSDLGSCLTRYMLHKEILYLSVVNLDVTPTKVYNSSLIDQLLSSF